MPYTLVIDLSATIGVCLFTLCALYIRGFSRFLCPCWLHHVDKISYSLYLLHTIVLLSLTYRLFGVVQNWAI